MLSLSGSFLFLKNPLHHRYDNGHLGGGLAASNEPLLQAGDYFVFSPATGTGLQMSLAFEQGLAVQQPFRAGDHIVPAFSAVHNYCVWLTVGSVPSRAANS